MPFYNWAVFIPLLFSAVRSKIQDGCLVYDLESDLSQLKYDATICEPFPQWVVGNYSQNAVESPNSGSKSFVTPISALSCIASLPFRASGGVIEINVYLDGKSTSDILQALLMMTSNGNDVTVAAATISSKADLNGWHTMKLDVLDEHGDFEGYIAFLGLKSDDSTLLVDSFRYVPKTVNKKTCPIYEGKGKTESSTLNPYNQNNDQCITYNFEEDFNILFNSVNYLCDGFPSWNLINYTSINMKSPEKLSSVFIKPSESLSCISSFVFTMEPNGVIEANVYVNPKSEMDHIIVIAQKVTTRDIDTVAGFTMYYPEDRNFEIGWNVLSFRVLDLTSFDGYLIFFGGASEESTVLVDSVRYIPPSISSRDKSCLLY